MCSYFIDHLIVDQFYSIGKSYPMTILVTFCHKNLYIGYAEVNVGSDNNNK